MDKFFISTNFANLGLQNSNIYVIQSNTPDPSISFSLPAWISPLDYTAI